MNLYEDQALAGQFEDLSDQLGLLVLDLLRAGVQKARRETQVFQDLAEAQADAPDHPF